MRPRVERKVGETVRPLVGALVRRGRSLLRLLLVRDAKLLPFELERLPFCVQGGHVIRGGRPRWGSRLSFLLAPSFGGEALGALRFERLVALHLHAAKCFCGCPAL